MKDQEYYDELIAMAQEQTMYVVDTLKVIGDNPVIIGSSRGQEFVDGIKAAAELAAHYARKAMGITQ